MVLDTRALARFTCISDYLSKDLILFLSSSDRDEAIEKMSDLLIENHHIDDRDSFIQAILEREKIVSTGIGMGIAIPHAKQLGFSHFFIAIGIQSDVGIEWNSLDDLPVHLVFMIGGPANKQNEYLAILSALTYLVRDKELRSRLIQAKSREEVFELIQEAEENH